MFHLKKSTMKKIAFLIGFCILFIGFIPVLSQAQEATPPTNFVVFEEFVSPADLPAFLKAQERAVELWKKHILDVSIWTYRNDDNAYYWIIPIENFSGLDELYEKMMEISKKMKEDGFDGDKEFRGLTTGRQTIIRWSQDLSYHPNSTMGQSRDKPYVEWMFCYLKAGHEKEAAEAAKKYIEFYNSIDETYEWDIYMAMIGHDTPMWIFMTTNKNAMAMRQLETELFSKYPEELKELWAGFAQHMRKFENKNGWFLPNWSLNIPE